MVTASPAPATPLAETRQVWFSYRTGTREQRGVQDVSMTLHPGRVVFVLGPNGSGKSTLFRLLLGLLQPSQGSVHLDGRPTDALRPRDIARIAAYIPQQDEVTFSFSVRDTVLMGRTPHLGQLASRPSAADYALADAAIETLGIAHLADRGVRDISGGERQLTMLARALCQQGRLLVLDEPTASLDFANQERVLQEVHRLSRTGLGVLVSSHDPVHALRFADDILLLREGHKVWTGPAADLDGATLSEVYGLPLAVATTREVPDVRVCVPLTSPGNGTWAGGTHTRTAAVPPPDLPPTEGAP